MIVACPNCASRYDVPETHLGRTGALLRCMDCDHSWIETRRSLDVTDVPHQMLGLPAPASFGSATVDDLEVSALVDASRMAADAWVQKKTALRRHRQAWGVLALFMALPVAAAAAFPEQVVSMAPATEVLYRKAGIAVNIYGLDIIRVEQQHLIDGTARILAVKGEIWNSSGKDRRMPALRMSLRNTAGLEVYSWIVDATVRPLRPGETSAFTTRVQAPPENAETLEVRFAHLDELTSAPIQTP